MTVMTRDVISPDLRTTLRALKLGQMLDTLPDRLTLARQQKMPHADFLQLILADEVTRREAEMSRTACPGRRPGPGNAAGCLGRQRRHPLRPAAVERARVAAVPRRPARGPDSGTGRYPLDLTRPHHCLQRAR